MSVRFADWQHDDNPLEGVRFDDAERLWTALRALRYGDLYLVELEHTNGARLVFGVGSAFAPAQVTGGDEIAHVAISDDANRDEDLEFLCGDTPTAIHARHCLAGRQLREVVSHFIAKGERNLAVSWELA
jgi:hypothetical protein